MLTKTNVIESLKVLPDNFTIDELLEHLVFVQKVEEGLRQSENGKAINSEEVKKRLNKWL
ncbi:MAG: hypothetical protein K9G38_08115 [Bacteroidales bacterium]|nr:hypothetical protein [Bacteroidales bacterium]